MILDQPGDPLRLLVRQSPTLAHGLRGGRIDKRIQQGRQRQRKTARTAQSRERFQHAVELRSPIIVGGARFRAALPRPNRFPASAAPRPHGWDRSAIRRISMAMRSGLTTWISAAISRMAARASSSSEKANVAANRTARNIRSLSSANRSRASPMARRRLAARSSCPPTKSITRCWIGIVEKAVDRKVAARGVFLGRAERDAVGMAAVAVGGVAAERGDFDHAGLSGTDHRNHSESGPDGQRATAAEQLADLIGHGVGGHVVVLRRASQELIADAAAGPIRFKPRPAQPADHFHGKTALFFRYHHAYAL